MAIANLLIKIGADIAELKTGSDEAVRHFKKTGEKIDSIGGTIEKTMKGIGAAFVVREIAQWVSTTINAASRIEDLAKKLSVSTDAVQRWTYGLSLSGGTIDDVDTALSFMNKTLGAGENSTKVALGKAGLAFEDIRKMRPEDAFDAITTAIAGIENPLVQAAVHMALFGRGGGDLLAALKNGFVETAKEAVFWSKETIARLDAAGDSWTKLANVVTIASGELIANTIDGFQNLGAAVEDSVSRSFQALHFDTAKAIADLQDLKGWMDTVRQTSVFAPKAPGAPGATGLKPLAAIALSAKEAAEIGENYDKVRKKLDEGAIAARKYADEFRAGVNAMKGVDAIEKAAESLKRLNASTREGIPLQKMTREQYDALNKTMRAAIDVNDAHGKVSSEAIRKVYLATLEAIPLTHNYGKALEDAGFKILPLINNQERLAKLGGGMWPQMIHDVERFIKIEGKLIDTTEHWSDGVGELAHAMGGLGQTISGAFGGLLGAGAQVMGSFDGMRKAADEFGKTARHSAAQTATHYLSMATAVFSWGKMLVDTYDKIKDALTAVEVNAVKAAHGGMAEFRHEALLAGQSVDRLFSIRKATPFRKELARIEDSIKQQNDLMERYGLTWRDFGKKVSQSQVDQYTRQLLDDFKLLTARGVDVTRAIEGQSGALNQLIVDAIKTGTKIPAALQPILEKLIRMGGLTDAAARAMLGLAADTMPSLADIKDAADRYGLSLDALGPKVQQLKITETANQIVRDFDLLVLAGADVGTVMLAMKDKVQGLVTNALTLGLKLPESMRPLLEKMVEAGFLTDEFGKALKDLSGIKFEKPLTEAIGDLIAKLDELIDRFSAVGTAAEDGFRRARGEAEATGRAIPRGYASGGTVLSFASGGRVGSDTVPAWLTPGEIVLNAAQQASVADVIQGGVTHIVLEMDGRVIAEVAVDATRKDAARGGLRPRAAHGRSY